jgi:acid phosphatase
MRTWSNRYVLSGRAGWVRLGIIVWLVLVGEFVPQSATAQGAMARKAQAKEIPQFDHVVIVIEENKNRDDVIGNTTDAQYINQLASVGASFTNAHGEWHPSQPNYFALFSGSMQGITSDDCPPHWGDNKQLPISADKSLGGELLEHKYRFGTYSENLPQKNLNSCYAYLDQNGHLQETNDKPEEQSKDPNDPRDQYVRRHNPWISFTDVPREMLHAWTTFPNNATDFEKNPEACNSYANAYSSLPTVSFVIPNNQHEMHTVLYPAANVNLKQQWLAVRIKQGNQWLKQHMSCYVQWAGSHNSLLIVTWDEDGSTDACEEKKTEPVVCPPEMIPYPDKKHEGTTPDSNVIPTIFVGAHVKPNPHGYSEWLNHYNILRTLEDMYGLGYLGASASVPPITDVWQ